MKTKIKSERIYTSNNFRLRFSLEAISLNKIIQCLRQFPSKSVKLLTALFLTCQLQTFCSHVLLDKMRIWGCSPPKASSSNSKNFILLLFFLVVFLNYALKSLLLTLWTLNNISQFLTTGCAHYSPPPPLASPSISSRPHSIRCTFMAFRHGSYYLHSVL